MNRLEFLRSFLGLSAGGLLLPKTLGGALQGAPKLVEQKPIKVYDNFVRGLTHYHYDKLKPRIKEGDELVLKREAKNNHDHFAIGVYHSGEQLGFIAAYENIVLANMLDSGVKLKGFVGKHIVNNAVHQRVAIEVYVALVTPSSQLIKWASDKRADDENDIYRRGFQTL